MKESQRGPDGASVKDPIQLELFKNELTSIANEIGFGIQRAAYSTNIKTRLDFSCAIFDEDMRMMSQSFSIPVHLGSLVHFVPRIIGEYGPKRLKPGDVVVCNDGHRGGIHLNDVCVCAPVWWGDRMVGYVATLAHHVDVGGGTPGSIGLAKEIYAEGLVIPPVLLCDSDGFRDDVLGLLLANVRAKVETAGDLRAQVAGLNVGTARIAGMLSNLGIDEWRRATEELLDYTELRVRKALAGLPEGTFEAEGFMDSDGYGTDPVRVHVSVTIDSSGILFDLSGSDGQRSASINSTYAMSLSNCAYAIRAFLDSDLPTNDGFYRVVRILAPSGSIVNCKPPAAISSGWETGFRVCETAMLALAQAMPTRACAGSKGCLSNIMFGGIDPRTGAYFAFFDSLAGGYGGRATRDGIDAIQPHVQNTENAPIEETEANYPIRILRYEMIQDSGGAGRSAGGMGLRRDYTFEGPVRFSVMADKARFPPYGLFGGLEASPSRFVLSRMGSDVEELPSKFSVDLNPGDVISVRMGGGGGYGPPDERYERLIELDLDNEKISAEYALQKYGYERLEQDDASIAVD